MNKRVIFFAIISIILLGCASQPRFFLSPTNMPPTLAPAIVQTQLALPIHTYDVDSISRKSNDFLPSPTPLPSVTPTNIFLPVVSMNEYSDLVITMERTFCFGRCPVYKLKIYGDGKGIYEGRISAGVEGIQNFMLTKNQLDELVRAFEAAYYFSFRDYYAVGVTDVSTTHTSITFQGYSKAVSHYGWCHDYEKFVIPEGMPKDAAPQALCDLENRIDEIVNIKQWTGQ